MTLKIPIAIFTLFIGLGNPIYAFKLSKSFEINFDYEVTFFNPDDHIMVWDDKTSRIYIYEEDQRIKTININKGQGPQDFEIVSAILVNSDQYYVWDRKLRRFTIYNKKWDPVEIKNLRHISFSSLPLGVTDEGFLFTWNELVRHKKGSDLTGNIGIIKEDGQKNSLYKISGAFNKMGSANYDRPILIAAFTRGAGSTNQRPTEPSSGSKLYFADNREYKIYAMDLNSKNSVPSKVIERKVKSIPWRKEFEELQREVIGESPDDTKYIYPGFLPPLFSLAANDELVAVISNELLHEKKTVVDFFKGGKFLGTAKLPLLYSQYFVFPSFLIFPPDVYLGKDYLLTFVYDAEAEDFKLIKWKIEQ